MASRCDHHGRGSGERHLLLLSTAHNGHDLTLYRLRSATRRLLAPPTPANGVLPESSHRRFDGTLDERSRDGAPASGASHHLYRAFPLPRAHCHSVHVADPRQADFTATYHDAPCLTHRQIFWQTNSRALRRDPGIFWRNLLAHTGEPDGCARR